MKITQAITDKFAIGLSLMCAIHCLVLPVLLVLLPSLMALNLDNEAFHIGMVIAVLPTSVFALTLGCKQHKRYSVVIFGGIGLSLLILALVLGEALMGEAGEKILTALGASFVALGHWFNYRLCQTHNHDDCACPEEPNQSIE